MLSNVLLLHEFILRILNQLSETDHKAPWVWTTSLQALQEYAAYLLLDDLFSSLSVDEQDDA